MKKLTAILLLLAMLFTLAACSGSGTSDTSASSAPSSAAPSAAPSESQAPSTGTTETTSGGQTQTSENPPVTDIKAEGFDFYGRDPYKIAYICNSLTWGWNNALDQTFARLGTIMNFEYIGWAANQDFDAYINQMYVFADQGYDGLIVGVDDALAVRAYEVGKELGIAFVSESTAMMDDDGICIWPSVVAADYTGAADGIYWLCDNYKTYWGEIDTTKLGLLVLDFSSVSGITARTPGASDAFRSRFPEAADNILVGDLLIYGPSGFSVQGGNDMAMATFSNNPQIEYWFVIGNVGDWAVGATRAAESLQMEDHVLACAFDADMFLSEMAGGYSGNTLVAACALSSTVTAIRLAEAVVYMLDGTYTAETLWPEWRDPGGSYPRFEVGVEIISRETYQQYLDDQEALIANYAG